jgi:hypothetical protein
MACQLSECHVKNQLTKDDTVAIMWSSVTREDRYFENGWCTPGNVYTSKVFDDKWIKKFADFRGYLIRDLAMINLASGFLENLGVNHYFFSMLDIDAVESWYTEDFKTDDVLWHYQKILNKLRPSVHNIIFNYDYNSRPSTIVAREASINPMQPMKFTFDRKKKRQDGHPSPAEHLEYLDKVLPEIKINDETRSWVYDITEKLKDPDFDIDTVWSKSKHIPVKL